MGKHTMCDKAGYRRQMGSTSVGTGHSQSLRLILKAAREEQHLSANVVAKRIRRHLQDLGDDDPKCSTSAIYSWESFVRHPSVAKFAAWARVLGFRLHVQLDAANSGRVPVLIGTDEAAEAARRIDRMSPAERASILAVIRSMSRDVTD